MFLFFTEWLIIWSIIYCFTSRSRIFHSQGDVTTADEGLHNIRPMLGAQGLWTRRNIYRATPAVIWGIGFSCIMRLVDWLIIYGFTSRSRIFHLYGDVVIAGEGLQNLTLCSALRAFEQGGIFIVPHLLWHRTSVFLVSSEEHTRVCGGSILTRNLTGFVSSEKLPNSVATYCSQA
jgi:hypothetical protein